MLTKRIIPCLDVKDGRVVKGVKFVDLRDKGDPAEHARRYDEEGADEITLLDITATTDGRRATAARGIPCPTTDAPGRGRGRHRGGRPGSIRRPVPGRASRPARVPAPVPVGPDRWWR